MLIGIRYPFAGNTHYGNPGGQWCSEYSNVKWNTTKTVHDHCPAGWRIPQKEDLAILVTKNTSISSTAIEDGGMLLKYDDTENRTYLRFTGYPPLITQLNCIGKEGYINAIDTKSVLKVSPSSQTKIEVAPFEDYDAHTTRCVQE